MAYQQEKLDYEKKRYEYHRKYGNEKKQKKDNVAGDKNPRDFLDEIDDLWKQSILLESFFSNFFRGNYILDKILEFFNRYFCLFLWKLDPTGP